ncbi:MAG: sulfotransferase [Chloroflexia bacterium]
MTVDTVKVLYIAGYGRSGSTVLDNVLGQLDGFFAGGEIRSVWSHGLVGDTLCGCGRRFRECPRWREILTAAYGGLDGVNANEMVQLGDLARSRDIPRLLAPGGEARVLTGLDEYREQLEKLYLAIRDTAGANVVVDSSKAPLYGYILDTLPSVEVYWLHLVRDPRAVAYSWARRKSLPDWGRRQYMPVHSTVNSALSWDLCNVATEAFGRPTHGRYQLLRYEDFVAAPRASVSRILAMLGENPSDLPFLDERTVHLEPGHGVSGNPSRFRTGAVELRPDDAWRRLLPPPLATS